MSSCPFHICVSGPRSDACKRTRHCIHAHRLRTHVIIQGCAPKKPFERNSKPLYIVPNLLSEALIGCQYHDNVNEGNVSLIDPRRIGSEILLTKKGDNSPNSMRQCMSSAFSSEFLTLGRRVEALRIHRGSHVVVIGARMFGALVESCSIVFRGSRIVLPVAQPLPSERRRCKPIRKAKGTVRKKRAVTTRTDLPQNHSNPTFKLHSNDEHI